MFGMSDIMKQVEGITDKFSKAIQDLNTKLDTTNNILKEIKLQLQEQHGKASNKDSNTN